MLDAFIIEKIKEREKEKQQDYGIPLYIEEYIPEPTKDKEDSKKEPVVIQL